MPDSSTPLGRRDRAILELFYASGLRLSELVGLDMEDVNLSGRMVRVLGKGRKERLVPFNTTTADALRAWLKRSDPRARSRRAQRPRAEDRERRVRAAVPELSRRAALDAQRRSACPAVRRGSAARSSASARTRCGTRSPRTCWPTAPTCARSRSCSATRGSSTTQRYTHVNAAQLIEVYRKAAPDEASHRARRTGSSSTLSELDSRRSPTDVAAPPSAAVAARELDPQRLDLVVHHARADAEQLRRVLLHPVRHPQRFHQRAALDLLQRDAGRRNPDER